MTSGQGVLEGAGQALREALLDSLLAKQAGDEFTYFFQGVFQPLDLWGEDNVLLEDLNVGHTAKSSRFEQARKAVEDLTMFEDQQVWDDCASHHRR